MGIFVNRKVITNMSQAERYFFSSGVIEFAIPIIVLSIFVAIAGLLAQIFLALSVYNDAKAKGCASPSMWGVLTGFFGWIPAIIYLCVRNGAGQRMLPCPSCSAPILANMAHCPGCGNENPFCRQFYGEAVEAAQKRAKGYLVGAICAYAAGILLVIAIIVVLLLFAGDFYSYMYLLQ